MNDVRTYSVTLVSGQTIEVDPSQPFVGFTFDPPGSTATLALLGAPQPRVVVATATLPGGLTWGTHQLTGRSSDGRPIQVSLSVTT